MLSHGARPSHRVDPSRFLVTDPQDAVVPSGGGTDGCTNAPPAEALQRTRGPAFSVGARRVMMMKEDAAVRGSRGREGCVARHGGGECAPRVPERLLACWGRVRVYMCGMMIHDKYSEISTSTRGVCVGCCMKETMDRTGHLLPEPYQLLREDLLLHS